MTNLSKANAKNIQNMRSINIALDLSNPERLVGYIPTKKSISLTNEIFGAAIGQSGGRAFAIAAPYGSGKSSVGLLWCLLAEGGAKDLPDLKTVVDAVRKQDREDNPVQKFLKSKKKLLAIPVEGYEGSVVATLLKGLVKALQRAGEDDLAEEIKNTKKTITQFFHAIEQIEASLSSSHSGILIVWDEFGKLLESAAAASDTRALFEIQTIAEYASRSSNKFPLIFSLLLHQSFARYASNLPAYVRTEWAKIEGRFKQINYIEDSKEIYELISQVIARGSGQPISDKSVYSSLAKKCHEVGIFKEFDLDSLADVLWASAPLSPVALFLLPRVSARVAQNERTLFSFLCSDEPNGLKSLDKEWVTPADIFEFFSDLMRVDSAIGGTHRQWVETGIATSKAEDDESRDLIKILSCMKIGASQSPMIANEHSIALSIGQTDTQSTNEIKTQLKKLLSSKVVFYRRLNNEYSIWQGSDVDIRTAVEELKGKFAELLDISDFLEKEYPAPFRYPQRHNDQNAIRRYYSGKFCTLDYLKKLKSWNHDENEYLRDGQILYLICETKDELSKAKKMIEDFSNQLIVVALPRSPLSLRESAVELKAYHELLADPEFCGQDPVVDQEIRTLADECESYLKTQVDKLTMPSLEGPIYVYKGDFNNGIHSSGSLKRYLSEISDSVFTATPRLNNEMINKADPSAQIVNARKKLMRAILDNNGQENLGLEGYGPEVSIFRAVFLQTGLYRQVPSGEWKLTEPRYLKDGPLKEVWTLFYDFWNKPSEFDKDPAEILRVLMNPPFGLREGLYPLLTAAGYVMSSATINVMDSGIYVADMKAETFEKMLRSPKSIQITIPPLDSEFKEYLSEVTDLFAPGQARKGQDPVRLATQSIIRWAKTLSACAMERGMHNADADAFVLVLKSAKDPTKLHRTEFIEASSSKNFKDLLKWLRNQKSAIENIEPNLLKKVKESILAAIGAKLDSDLTDCLRQWKKTLPGDESSYQADPIIAGFLTRISTNYDSEQTLIRSLAEQFSGKVLRFWDNKSLPIFEMKAHHTVKMIEDLADALDLEKLKEGETKNISIPWIEKRLTNQIKALNGKLGLDTTKDILNKILGGLEQ
jgi:hypothetical protein